MTKTYFITGIGTEVGKTIVSAVVTEAPSGRLFQTHTSWRFGVF